MSTSLSVSALKELYEYEPSGYKLANGAFLMPKGGGEARLSFANRKAVLDCMGRKYGETLLLTSYIAVISLVEMAVYRIATLIILAIPALLSSKVAGFYKRFADDTIAPIRALVISDALVDIRNPIGQPDAFSIEEARQRSELRRAEQMYAKGVAKLPREQVSARVDLLLNSAF